jgi:hypothetical protein
MNHEMNVVQIVLPAMLFMAAATVESASAQSHATQLACDGAVTLYGPSFQQGDFSGAIVTVGDDVEIENLPMVSETWPIRRVTDTTVFFGSETTSGSALVGGINRLTGEMTITVWAASRAEINVNGRCAPARRIF